MSSNESHWDIQWIVISPVKNLADTENNAHRLERIYGISFRLFNLISHESAQRTQSGLSSWSREEKFRILQATTYYFAYYSNILLTGRSWLNSSFTFIHGAKIERASDMSAADWFNRTMWSRTPVKNSCNVSFLMIRLLSPVENPSKYCSL